MSVRVCACVCGARAWVYPVPKGATETGLDEPDLSSTGPLDQLRNGQAPVRDTCPCHHNTSNLSFPMQTLDSAGNNSKHRSVASQHINSGLSPCRPSISQETVGSFTNTIAGSSHCTKTRNPSVMLHKQRMHINAKCCNSSGLHSLTTSFRRVMLHKQACKMLSQ